MAFAVPETGSILFKFVTQRFALAGSVVVVKVFSKGALICIVRAS